MDARTSDLRRLIALIAAALDHQASPDDIDVEVTPWPPPTPWPAILREHGVTVGEPRWLGQDWPEGGEAVALNDLARQLSRLHLRDELAHRAGCGEA